MTGPKREKLSRLWAGALDLTAWVLVLAYLVPFAWLVATSFKYPVDFLAWPPRLLPELPTLDNYRAVFQDPLTMRYFGNTVTVASAATGLAVGVGSLAAYSLANVTFPFRFNSLFALWVLVTRMYPAVATAIPYFVLIRALGLLDTRLALIVTYTSFNLPLVIWFLLGFFQAIPRELEEAAIVDGCTLAQRFTRIGLPLVVPGIVTAVILSFVLGWNEFLFAVILTSLRAKTIPVQVSEFITDKGLEWGAMSALGTSLVLPVILLAWAVQRYLVQGLTMGAVKG